MFFDKNKMDIYRYSSIGGREENEDSLSVFKKGRFKYCFLVADGLGGHGGGANASKIAVDTLGKQFMEDKLKEPEDFYLSFQEANRSILKIQTRECQMKTTLVSLIIDRKYAFWSHIGDSRLYFFVDDKLVEQTFDHSVSQMAVIRGEIKQEELRKHEDRNRLLRALGIKSEIKIDISEKKKLRGRRTAFLLCTDGFWEYVYETEMEETLRKCKNAKEWTASMLQCMKNRIKEGNDNNTVITVIIDNK